MPSPTPTQLRVQVLREHSMSQPGCGPRVAERREGVRSDIASAPLAADAELGLEAGACTGMVLAWSLQFSVGGFRMLTCRNSGP